MTNYETNRRRIQTVGGILTALTLYLLLVFTGLSDRQLVSGSEGAYASAGDPGIMALGALNAALRGGGGAPPMLAAHPLPRLPRMTLATRPPSADVAPYGWHAATDHLSILLL